MILEIINHSQTPYAYRLAQKWNQVLTKVIVTTISKDSLMSICHPMRLFASGCESFEESLELRELRLSRPRLELQGNTRRYCMKCHRFRNPSRLASLR